MHPFKTALSVFIFLLTLASNAFAQSRGAIIISVKDQFDGVISNAVVTLAKSGADEKKGAQTNELGTARILNLPDGEYQIIVQAPGFKEDKSQKVTIKGGETKRVEIALEVAPVESSVNIGETETAEPEKSGVTTVLSEKQIENLPDDQEELEKTIKRIGQAIIGDEATISVNGVQGGKIPPKQAIQQIRINQNVFSAQYDGPFGGGIEIFTRSSIKDFKRFVNFNFADSRFNAADPFLGRRLPYQSRNYSFSLLGPLGKKANFFVFGGHNESDLSAVVNAFVLDGNLQPIAFKQSFASPSRSENMYLNINADPNKKHKLSLNYSFNINRGQGQNVGGLSLPSRANSSKFQNHYLQFADTYLVNPNIVNQTRFSGFYSTSKNFGGSRDVAINVLDSFFGGGSQQEFATRSFRFDVTNDTTWQMGRYGLGFGWRLRGENINQNSKSNFGGTYTFSGRLAPVLDANNNPVTDSAGTIVTSQISSLESYRRTLLFQRQGFSSQRIRELGGGANQFTISGGNPEIKASQYDTAFYVQNSYKISDVFAVSTGIRYENQTNINSGKNFALRFGFIWSPKAKEKANPLYALPRVSVGYGVFYSRFPLSNILSVRQANGADRLQYLVTDANILNFYPSVPSVDLLQQFALPGTKRFIDDELGTSYQSLLNINATKPILKGYNLSFAFSREKVLRQPFIKNINAPLAGTYNVLNPATAVRPFGNVGNIYETSSIGTSERNRFSVNLNFPQSPKLFANIRYSFTKSKNDVVSGTGASFDPYDFSQELSPGTADGIHSVSGYYDYSLPHRISIGGDFSISSGTRFNIFTGRDTNGDGFYSERPSFATDLSKPNLVQTKYGLLDPNPLPGDKLIPRNLGRGPKNVSFNSYLSKVFAFGADEKAKKPPKQTLRFSLNINNVFNIINRGTPIGNMSSPNFLRSISGFSDSGTIVIINGAQRPDFVGRSMSFSVGFGF